MAILNYDILNDIYAAQGDKDVGLDCIFIYDNDGWRTYCATDGHIMLVAEVEIEEYDGAPIEKPIAFRMDGKIKKDKHFSGGPVEEGGIIRTSKETKTVSITEPHIINGNTPPEIVNRLLFKEGEKVKHYRYFNPKYLKIVKDFIGIEEFYTRPFVRGDEADITQPVCWHGERCNPKMKKYAVLMPVRGEV